MPFCAQCGSEGEGNFCPACGAPRAGTAAPPASAPASSGQLEDNIAGALAYLIWPLSGVLFLVIEPFNRNRFVRFHAIQSILAFAALFIGFLILSFLAYLPFIGLMFTMLTIVYPLLGFGVWIFLMFKAYNKERFQLPVIGPIAEKQA